MKHILFLFFLGLLALFASGCLAPSYDLHVYASKQFLKEYNVMPAMEVDVLAPGANDARQLEIYDINEYFQVNNPMRRTIEHCTIYFSDDDVLPKRMKGGHPLWSKAGKNEASTVFLMVNLPFAEAKPGLNLKDTRRISIPLERSWFGWFSPDKYFLITPQGILQKDEQPEEGNYEVDIMELKK